MQKQRKHIRIQSHDYSLPAMYFITSSVKDNRCIFGKVLEGKMILNAYGNVAAEQLYWLGKHYKFLRIPVFVIMPNHVHFIVDIHGNSNHTTIRPLPQLMSAYKSRVSSKIRNLGLKSFCWHRSYYDHMIRTEHSYMRIVQYIQNNPRTWNQDSMFPNN